MVSKFDTELPLQAAPLDLVAPIASLSHGPCAMGPVGDGEKLLMVHVMLLQTVGGRHSSATGRSGSLVRVGAATPPFAGRWEVNTRMDEGSDEFVVGKPAFASAMAVVRKGGKKTVKRWSREVRIVAA